MEAWTFNLTVGELLIDFSIVGGLLLLAAGLRNFVPFFKRFLVPCSLIAGFLGLMLGNELVRLIPIDAGRMGAYVYHLLALTFIGVGLYRTERKHTYGVVNLGFIQIAIMLIQGMIGLGIALITVWLILPDLNPAAGMLLPLGFAMGPGIAYSIGQSWTAFGFEGAGSMGLTIAAVGFLVAYFWGMRLVNRFSDDADSDRDPPESTAADTPLLKRRGQTTLGSESIEPLALLLALVGGLYAATFLITDGLASLLVQVGLEQEVPILWSFHFIIANLVALFTRHVLLRRFSADWLSDELLARTTGALADYLIATSIMAISLTVAWRFAAPILLICILGSLMTYFVIRRVTWGIFHNHRFERFIGMFAQMTGTISSGLALVKVTDPDFDTPVAQELVLSSGMALALGFPLLLVINMPFTVFDGSTRGFIIVLGLMLAYLIMLVTAWVFYLQRFAPEKTT